MIATIAAIAATKRVQGSQRQDRSYGNHIPAILAIAATTIVFHIITMFAGIAELSFPLGDRSDR